MATAGTIGATGNQDIDGVLSGWRWIGTVTYSFPDSAADYSANYGSGEPTATGFAQISAAQQTAVNSAMALIMSYTNINIQYAGTNGADVMLAQSSAANPTAYAYYPGNYPEGGDVWFGTSYNFTNPRLGDYYYHAHIHELGHSFGLKHSQEIGGPANVAVPSIHDALEFSVMSYRSYVGGPTSGGYTNETYGYPQTYMMNDILALQTMYGADYTSNSGNSVYTFSSTTGEMFINSVGQGQPGGGAGGASANRIFRTVWDGGGNDTYDLSNYAAGVTINLNPGAWSITSNAQLAYLGNNHYAQGNVYNAYLFNNDARSYIENATGGSSNDTIWGNAANNTLTGGAGNDTIDGGANTDSAVFSGMRSAYTLTALSGNGVRVSGPDGTDTLTNVEQLVFSDQTVTWPVPDVADLTATNLTFNGTTLSYRISDNGGVTAAASTTGIYFSTDSTITTSDTLLTTNSTPSLAAGASDNESVSLLFPGNLVPGTYYIGALADYNGLITESDETNNASNAVPIILGNDSDNTLTGTSGNDTILGLAGNDTINDNGGNDTLVGGLGDDTYIIHNSADTVVEQASQGTDTVYADVNFTLPNNVDILVLTGSVGLSGAGNTLDNQLWSNTGVDTLTGGLGNDAYIIHNTADIVVEQASQGNDTVVADVNFTLANNIEILALLGSAGLSGTGNGLDNTIYSNTGVNNLTGGGGNDTYIVHNSSDQVVELASQGTDIVFADVSFTLANNVENLVLTGSAVLSGTGNTLDNQLWSNTGVDTLTGGLGNDSYIIHNSSDQVIEQASQGTDTVVADVSFTLANNVENLFLLGSANLNATGNALDNYLYSNTGIDTLTGGAGNDSYIVHNSGDILVELASQGTDFVSADASFILPSNVENLVLLGSANLNGTGNSGVNTIYGNSGNNVLAGAGGSDTFVFLTSFGQDTITDFDVLTGHIAFDHTLFTDANDVLAHTAVNGVITDTAGDILTLTGVTKADLQAHMSDFLLV